MDDASIKLGDRARDRISGLEGIVIGRSDFLTGCRQFCIRPESHKDGKPIEGTWFDEKQLVVTQASAVTLGNAAPDGGPSLDPCPRC